MKCLANLKTMAATLLALFLLALLGPMFMNPSVTVAAPQSDEQANDPPSTDPAPSPPQTPFCDGMGNPDPPITPCGIRPNMEVFITDLCVVNDACRTNWDPSCPDDQRGAWTVGKLMASMAGFQSIDDDPVALSNFVKNWLLLFASDQPVNGFTVLKRAGINNLINKWETISGGPVLDMKLAPFRLEAIVNRLDLRNAPGPYSTGNAGEGRFVFEFLDIQTNNPNPNAWFPLTATLILEYELPAETCDDIVAWAEAWHSLGSFQGFDDSYKKRLQEITDAFAGVGAKPGAPNDSAISQVRTNEIAFGAPWELREFKLVPSTLTTPPPFVLGHVTVAQTVDITFSEFPGFGDPTGVKQQLLGQWMTDNEIDINHERHIIPLTLPDGTPFNAGSSLNPGFSFFWTAPEEFDFDCRDTRFNFGINNCNGCHAREGDLQNFVHVNFRGTLAQQSTLSEFLTGAPLNGQGTTDPSCLQPPEPGAVTRQFNDIRRRTLDLCAILTIGCPEGGRSDLDQSLSIFNTGFTTNRVH